MKVYDSNCVEVEDYIGCHYPAELFPQPIYLRICAKSESAEIDYDSATGGETPMEAYYGHVLRFHFLERPISLEKSEKILADLDPLIKGLLESYKEEYRDGNYYGYWDDELTEKVEEYLKGVESDLWFDREGIMDEQEEELDL